MNFLLKNYENNVKTTYNLQIQTLTYNDCFSRLAKKSPLTLCLNELREELCLIFSGSLFHKEGPRYDIEFSPMFVLRKG